MKVTVNKAEDRDKYPYIFEHYIGGVLRTQFVTLEEFTELETSVTLARREILTRAIAGTL